MADALTTQSDLDGKFLNLVGDAVSAALQSDRFEEALHDELFKLRLASMTNGDLDAGFIDWYDKGEAILVVPVEHGYDDQKSTEVRNPLSQLVLKQAENADKGYSVAGTIAALEASIEKMKAGMEERGWTADSHA